MVKIKVARKQFVPTPRDVEILAARCAAGGRGQAATLLGISVHTVEKHLDRMRIGFGAHDDAHLCVLAHDLIAPHLETE